MEYKVKAGSVPSIQAIQKKSIHEVDFDQVITNLSATYDKEAKIYIFQLENNKIMNPVEISQQSSNNHYVSLVDISKLTQNSKCETDIDDQQIDIKFEPLMPLIIALMKRKSVLYTGLQQSRLARLIFIVAQQTTLTEVMLMLTLRKLRLNEDFEVLADMFDVDKTTAEQYFEDSKQLVLELSQTLTNESKNVITTSTIVDTTSNPIKLEPMDMGNEYVDEIQDELKDCGSNGEDEEDETETDSTTSDLGYKGQVDKDPDFETENLESSDSSELDSDSEASDSEILTDDSNSAVKALCPHCNKLVFRLESHIYRIHLNPSNINKTICGLCLKTFSNQLVLRKHQKEYHDGNAYSCDICGFMEYRFHRLKEHISRKHYTVKDFLCHFCGDGFPYQHRLHEHVKKKHLMIRTNVCNLCDKAYFEKNSLESHIRSEHTGERPHKCVECGKAFARKTSLVQHKQVHREARYPCDVCEKNFGFKYNLNAHRKNVHGILG